MSNDYVPSSDGKFLEFAKTIVKYVAIRKMYMQLPDSRIVIMIFAILIF
jgi:hypothetical protein